MIIFGNGYLFLTDVPSSLHLPTQVSSRSESDQVNLGITFLSKDFRIVWGLGWQENRNEFECKKHLWHHHPCCKETLWSTWKHRLWGQTTWILNLPWPFNLLEPWSSYLISLNLSWFIYKMGIITSEMVARSKWVSWYLAHNKHSINISC